MAPPGGGRGKGEKVEGPSVFRDILKSSTYHANGQGRSLQWVFLTVVLQQEVNAKGSSLTEVPRKCLCEGRFGELRSLVCFPKVEGRRAARSS